MLSSICQLLPSTVCPRLARSASFSKEIASAFPLRHLLGTIVAWSSCARYHSPPNIFRTHLKQTVAHCHWLLTVVNYESWRFSPDSRWFSQMLWNAWSQFLNICWSGQPQLTWSHLTVKDLISPGLSLAMDLVAKGLTWPAQGEQDCLLADIQNTFCKIFLSLCQSRATILLIATSLHVPA